MNERDQEATPLAEGVWPPPPRGWEGAEGGVRVEQVEVWQERDRLTLRNGQARQLLVFGGCALLFAAFLPLLLSLALSSVFPITSTHYGVWAYVAFFYRHNHYEFLLMALMYSAGIVGRLGFHYERRLHRGYFVLDKRGGAIRAGGGLFCLMSELDHVLIRRALGKWQVYLMRVGGDGSMGWGGFGRTRIPRNACLVADFRQQISAEDVAGIVAEFAGVPVRYQAGA